MSHSLLRFYCLAWLQSWNCVLNDGETHCLGALTDCFSVDTSFNDIQNIDG